jgi:pimeloyl-ACP methyl ester carboxylesterase
MRLPVRLIVTLLITGLPSLATAQDKLLDSTGVQIRYVEQGTGEPIVLVHGFTSNIERGWIETGVLPNLAKDFHVVALDNRGHGKSGKPHDPKAYGNEMSEDVVRLLDHLNIQRAHIVGYSMGGAIVVKLLTTHPERFLTATLGGSAGRRHWTSNDDRTVDTEAGEIEKGSFRPLIMLVAPTDQPPPTDEFVRQQSQVILNYGNDSAALAAFWRNRGGQAVTDTQMAAVRVPTLAVIGSADPAVADVNELRKVMPSMKVVVIQGAAHAGERAAQRRPEFVNSIREFIAAQPKKSGAASR